MECSTLWTLVQTALRGAVRAEGHERAACSVQRAAVAEVDDCPHHCGRIDLAAGDRTVVPDELRSFHGALRPRCPEVDADVEPVVSVRAPSQMLFACAGQHPPCDRLAAVVKPEDESRLDLVQVPHAAEPARSALEPLRELAGRSCNAGALQGLQRKRWIAAKLLLELGNAELQGGIAES